MRVSDAILKGGRNIPRENSAGPAKRVAAPKTITHREYIVKIEKLKHFVTGSIIMLNHPSLS